MRWKHAAAYLPAQVLGCCVGAVGANLMFGSAAVTASTHHRGSAPHLLAETVTTLGLLLVIFSLSRTGRADQAPAGGVDEGHNRVQVRPGHGPDHQDDREQPGGGGGGVLQQLEPHVTGGQVLRGDPAADHDRGQEVLPTTSAVSRRHSSG